MFCSFKVFHFKNKRKKIAIRQPVAIELDAPKVGSNRNPHFDADYEDQHSVLIDFCKFIQHTVHGEPHISPHNIQI